MHRGTMVVSICGGQHRHGGPLLLVGGQIGVEPVIEQIPITALSCPMFLTGAPAATAGSRQSDSVTALQPKAAPIQLGQAPLRTPV